MDTKFFGKKILKESFDKDENELNKNYNELVKKRQNYIRNFSENENENNYESFSNENVLKKKTTNSDIDKLYKKKMFERNYFNELEGKKTYDPTYYLHPINNMQRESLKNSVSIKKDRRREEANKNRKRKKKVVFDEDNIKKNKINSVKEIKSAEDLIIDNFKNLGILD